MSKILIVSDIHLHAYPQRNPTNDYRLYQGRVVAQNIIEAGRREGCEYIVFAGDIIEKSILRPYVQAEAKYFLETIMKNFREGFIIWGNHDIDSKSEDQDIIDSCLGIMLPSNLHYMHRQCIKIDNTSIAFNNWQPEFDLDWIKTPVDVLITHARICYNPDADGLFESQKLDEDKFRLAICGDIHRMAQIGKYVSIGIPQRCKMGDAEESSGVVLDCASQNWSWVNLNPNDNLMKFAYVSDLDKEGWDENSHTWFVYKQDNSNLIGTGQNIKIAAWEEISQLITEAIIQAGLKDVHSEVLKNISNIDSGEVDFNFTITWFHCKNWRSIDECTINFKEGDKILLQGANGSGKSSLLSALKYAFVDVSDTTGLTSLKPFVQFGSKECYTEVEFLYQGNLCKLQRGTNTYGLWINGEQQKYSDKRSFEKDVRVRFPFIKYMDSFFLDSDHNTFIGSMTPEREVEIVSKFLKLDRLDTYNETARILSDQLRKDTTEWQRKIKETEKLLGYINDKLATIILPQSSKSELEEQKNQGLELQRRNNLWNQYVANTARLQASIQAQETRMSELSAECASFRDSAIINGEIAEINGKIKELQEELVSLGNIRVNLDFKNKELNNLKTEGNNAWKEAQSIAAGKRCSLCGQIMQTTESMIQHKNELLQRVEELKPRVAALQEEIDKLTVLRDNSNDQYLKINQDISTLNAEISKRMSEISHQQQVNLDYNRSVAALSNLNTELSSLGVVERVDLPDNFMSIMSSIEAGILSWSLWETNQADKVQKEQELGYYNNELIKLGGYLSQLDEYIKLTGPVGVIYEEIMNKLKDQFSDNQVQYVVTRKGKGIKEHLSLNPQYNNHGNWIDYAAASSGQRTLLDINFLSKIVTRMGLLVLDEFLKHLDAANHDVCLDMIKDMNIGCIMISSHMESIAAFNNKTCKLSLNDSGLTVINLE